MYIKLYISQSFLLKKKKENLDISFLKYKINNNNNYRGLKCNFFDSSNQLSGLEESLVFGITRPNILQESSKISVFITPWI